jgi:two-component system OmpR family response regulator
MLSAVGSDVDRIIGLEVGADDYLSKPCNPRELLARIRTVLRRRGEQGAAQAVTPAAKWQTNRTLQFEGWALDIDAFMALSPDGTAVPLTDGEFRLLRVLAEHPRRVLTRDQLLDLARGENADNYDRAIDVQISRLRRKLAIAGGGGNLIRTVRNEGYMFMAAVSRS